MWAEERHQRILEVLNAHTRIEAGALALALDVSRETIRRDLIRLEADGLIRRTHGGALVIDSEAEQPFRDRLSAHRTEKQAMGRAAASLIKPGDCCFIDAGSTTVAFAEALAGVEGISVITNSLDVASVIRSGQFNADIVLLGGALGSEVPATYGPMVVEQLARLRADIAFISPVGLDPKGGVSYFDLAEAEIARMMLSHARKRVVLADASKCGVVSRVVVWDCDDIDVVVSDGQETAAALALAGVGQFVLAEPG